MRLKKKKVPKNVSFLGTVSEIQQKVQADTENKSHIPMYFWVSFLGPETRHFTHFKHIKNSPIEIFCEVQTTCCHSS